MFDDMSDHPETVISWRGIGAHSPVVASDGVEVGHVSEVAAVYLKSTSQAAEAYEPFHEMHVKRLGLTGLFRWKHLGWKDSSE